MYRFFVDKKINDSFELSKEIQNHIKTIRLKKNENIICVYKSNFYICNIVGHQAKIISKLDENHEYKGNVVLFAAIINIKRFEWLIQKATELGVKEFYPIITQNTNPKLIDIVKNKSKRFEEIIKNSSEQSFRNNLMNFNSPISFIDSLKFQIKNKYLAHEKEKNYKQQDYYTNCAIYIGPEGGFTEEEVEIAQKNDVKVVSLGQRILRSETASLFLLSKLIDC